MGEISNCLKSLDFLTLNNIKIFEFLDFLYLGDSIILSMFSNYLKLLDILFLDFGIYSEYIITSLLFFRRGGLYGHKQQHQQKQSLQEMVFNIRD
jgi:hypothetical protein